MSLAIITLLYFGKTPRNYQPCNTLAIFDQWLILDQKLKNHFQCILFCTFCLVNGLDPLIFDD